ncbi:MAG: lysostaphin resistance A-like protein [Nitrospirales bacterium]|nr:CPBP family intramembrane metalloprotease [Nitrospirales bacterium]
MTEWNDRDGISQEAVVSSAPPAFSPFITLLSLMICLTGLGAVLWSTSLSEAPALDSSSSRNLERLASRVLSFEVYANRLSRFEQFLYRLGTEELTTREDILKWYGELFSQRFQALDGVYVGVLLGEFQGSSALHSFLGENPVDGEPATVLYRALGIAYLGETHHLDMQELQARLAETMPGNWFYFQLARRLAEQTRNDVLTVSLASQLDRQTTPILWKWRVGLGIELAILGLGGLCLILLMRFHVFPAGISFSYWTFGDGLAVLSRGGALTVVVLGVVAFLPGGPYLLMEFGAILLYLPIVLMAYALLFRSRQLSINRVFGCRPFLKQVRAAFPVTMSVLGLGMLGDWGIMILGDYLGYTVHWTEWFVPDLVWGGPIQVMKTLVEFVILAPLFEEIIFRGLLFPTLFVRFGGHVAIIGSGLLFALAHGYGLLAFLTVLWSGWLWGWAYYRTGSLVPGMLAHAINNGLVVYFLMAFFR